VRLLRLSLCALLGLGLAPGARRLRAAEDRPTAFTAGAPVVNFRVTTFTADGNRSWLLSGTKGIYVNQNQLDVTDLNLTVFVGNASNHVDSIFLSPAATALINAGQVHGPGSLRLITDDFEATGEDWFYDHGAKKISIRKNVRVVFHTELQSILR
jgi:hypothetical protein